MTKNQTNRPKWDYQLGNTKAKKAKVCPTWTYTKTLDRPDVSSGHWCAAADDYPSQIEAWWERECADSQETSQRRWSGSPSSAFRTLRPDQEGHVRQAAGLPGLATNSIIFYFLFVKKNHWFAWRANQWPLAGETLFSSVPPSNSLISVSDPRRAFWADTVPFLGPRLASPRALLPELQRYKDTVRCAALGAEVPGHRQQQLTQTLIVRLLKMHFFTSILDFEKSTE